MTIIPSNRADRPGQVSLPSIQEMFPDHIGRQSSCLGSRSIDPSNNNRPSSHLPPTLAPLLASRSAPRCPSIDQPASPGRSAHTGGYSFDILRPDASKSSLEHVAHSNTFRNRGCTISQHGMSTCIVNGSAPVFKVAPSLPVPHPYQETEPVSGAARRGVGASYSGANNVLAGYSSVLTFSESTSPTSAAIDPHRSPPVSSDDIYIHEKGKRHKCHICSKRFNRPSSLKIHVNTHTGATPFRCPHPACGREFNVNSNMRRHYRNHSMPNINPQLTRESSVSNKSPISGKDGAHSVFPSENMGEDVECKNHRNMDIKYRPAERYTEDNDDDDDDPSDGSDTLSSPTTPRPLSARIPFKYRTTRSWT